jgi:hypothetical protein
MEASQPVRSASLAATRAAFYQLSFALVGRLVAQFLRALPADTVASRSTIVTRRKAEAVSAGWKWIGMVKQWF